MEHHFVARRIDRLTDTVVKGEGREVPTEGEVRRKVVCQGWRGGPCAAVRLASAKGLKEDWVKLR